ncbi:hypothetical protein AB0L85_31020 [Streptomyces sp. NPDC052051]|uniref:hypothetical protein n=1 Tax=Streptomyces sp. NPDC052051 TaxID=3154649 RepID=UPI00342B8B2A
MTKEIGAPPPRSRGSGTFFLDGLDEGLNNLPRLDQLLDEALEEVPEPDREKVRLRVTCRSARRPGRIEESLRTRWQPTS